MPTYQYKCRNCEDVFEIEQRIVEDPLTECQKCKGAFLYRVIGKNVGVQFKGSGFYINDQGAGRQDSTGSKDSPS